jgi:putative tricarboxylic transport membrane protein
MRSIGHSSLSAVAALWVAQVFAPAPALAAWEPTRPVEFIVPAGTGGGADQMARATQGIVTKHNLMKQPLVVINKSGGAGGEGFLDVKGARNNPHKLIITLSNLFTTPLATGIPFSWKDMTPVAMLALDEFIFWVNGSVWRVGVVPHLKLCGATRHEPVARTQPVAITMNRQAPAHRNETLAEVRFLVNCTPD